MLAWFATVLKTPIPWHQPVVGETSDASLNDIAGFHVRESHVFAAMSGARGGAVAEGNVGGGTGMVVYGLKGGIGTSSRRVGAYTLGVLVQANYGSRDQLLIAGVPVVVHCLRWRPVRALRRRWTSLARGPDCSPRCCWR